MKYLLIFITLVSLQGQTLKDRIEKLIIPPEKRAIVQIKYDPFRKAQVVVQKIAEQKQEDKTLYIATILNGKIFASGSWHSVGDSVRGYKIIQISKESVLARKDGKVVRFGIKRVEKILKVEDK